MKDDTLKYNKKMDSVLLCCGGKKCPEVYNRDNDRIQIRDDDGFVITLSKEQALLIPKALEVLEGKE
tara:strand:+ start:88 stop:288 length:201 start_codon:yes stop_codon:yes gene_type:complete